MLKKIAKPCALCGKKMEGIGSQITQKIVCNQCSAEIHQARTLKKYHQLKNSPRFLYWKNKLTAMEATIQGKEVGT